MAKAKTKAQLTAANRKAASKKKPAAKKKAAPVKSKRKAPAKKKAKAAPKRNRLRIPADFKVKRTKTKPEEGSVYEALVKCVHSSGATKLDAIVKPFLKKKGVGYSEAFGKANGKSAALAFTRSYVLRSLKRGYLIAA